MKVVEFEYLVIVTDVAGLTASGFATITRVCEDVLVIEGC